MTEGSQIILKKLKCANESNTGANATLAPIAKGSCQPSKARMTEGLKAVSKTQVRYGKATLSSFRHSAYCLKATLRREGRERGAQPTCVNQKINQSKVKQPLRRGGFTAPRHLPWLRGGSMLVYIKLIDGLPTT
ncbi:MAG: hypothetical protein IKX16_01770, partial [Clostridia bacterium]|nr:hypothetical protein [Clostridia bacterium]